MFEHLSNCHGEWNAVFAFFGTLPFFGAWFRAKYFKPEVMDEER